MTDVRLMISARFGSRKIIVSCSGEVSSKCAPFQDANISSLDDERYQSSSSSLASEFVQHSQNDDPLGAIAMLMLVTCLYVNITHILVTSIRDAYAKLFLVVSCTTNAAATAHPPFFIVRFLITHREGGPSPEMLTPMMMM